MRLVRSFTAASTILLGFAAVAQETPPAGGPQYAEPTTTRFRVGMIVTAETGACQGIYGTAPVPGEWPEQQILVVGEDYSPFVKNTQYRTVGGTVQQMLVDIPALPAGERAEAVVTLDITRSKILAPGDTSIFLLPKKLDKQTRFYLGPSPGIETRNPKIKSLAREILKDKQDLPMWQKVETLYDWVRDNVKYEDGKFKGAAQALRDGHGDCEELSSLFIAFCRVNDVPARTVWVPGHCYPEFYLQDGEGNGFWFPCQAAGTREFGGISEQRPILQKGDNFSVPERPREQLRYVAEHLTGAGGQPKVKFLREAVGATR